MRLWSSEATMEGNEADIFPTGISNESLVLSQTLLKRIAARSVADERAPVLDSVVAPTVAFAFWPVKGIGHAVLLFACLHEDLDLVTLE